MVPTRVGLHDVVNALGFDRYASQVKNMASRSCVQREYKTTEKRECTKGDVCLAT